MKRVLVSAPGKLHLLGEHSVVYNKPAIIAAVNKRCFVEITPRKDKKIRISSKNYKKEITVDFNEIVSKFGKAQKDWEIYNENNDISNLKSITKDPLDYPLIVIGQFLNYYKIKTIPGFDLSIDSQIPVGCGMGSSGALAVSIIGALSLFTKKAFNKKGVNEIAFLAEQKKHGKPSGGDNSTSCFGGLVWFKKDEGLKPLYADLPAEVTKNFYIINTGTPKETTGEMVSLVRELLEKGPRSTNAVLNDQERLVRALLPALEGTKHDQIIKILRKGEVNLEKLGVVSSFAQKIIRDIERSGGAAKICGGGGKTKSVGIILIYHPDLQNLDNALSNYGFVSEQIKLGVDGLKEE
ncbi:MAG: Mevalonate kinase [Candidatus Levybacteria bacterium GW2011_GWA2_40_8]|nr:MAG: Mevalonate kinase [Candidatus Levybacteria bacterium GW2011_GWA2_40_8]